MTAHDASRHRSDGPAADAAVGEATVGDPAPDPTAADGAAVGGPAADAGAHLGDPRAPHHPGAEDEADAAPRDPADRWAERFERPALVAALAAVPATFLTLAEGTWETTGEIVNILSAAVLVAEGVVLFVTSRDRRAWARRNWWLLATIAVVIPATIFAVGPAQLLRLVRSLGALRVLRVRRIIKAGRIASTRLGLSASWRKVVVGVISLASAAFVAVVLADPSGMEVDWMADLAGAVGPVGVVVAGALLGVATYLVVRERGAGTEDDGTDETGADETGSDAAGPGATGSDETGSDDAGAEDTAGG